MAAIDLDRGVHIRYTRAGVAVYEYIGLARDGFRDGKPGHWYNDHGDEVGPQLAKEAGYDTAAGLRERKKRERIATATAAIEQEYRPEEAVNETVAEKNGYKAVHIGLDRHNIVDPDGNVLNKKALTKGEALRTLEAVASAEPEPGPVQAAAA